MENDNKPLLNDTSMYRLNDQETFAMINNRVLNSIEMNRLFSCSDIKGYLESKKVIEVTYTNNTSGSHHYVMAVLERHEQMINSYFPCEDWELINNTERNAQVIASFMGHCKDNDLVIPDELFESYFEC